jgi:replicative DNA helicase
MIRIPKSRDDLFVPAEQVEAEQGVLASILIKPGVLDDVQLELKPADFNQEPHRIVYEHLVALHDNGKPIDLTSLVASLRKARGGDVDTMTSVGGTAYLEELFRLLPSASHAVYYAKLVHDASLLRQLQRACDDTLTAVRNGQTAKDALAAAEKRIFAIGEQATGENLSEVAPTLGEAIELIERRKGGDAGGLKTGFHGLDEMTGGMRPGETIIVAGRTSMGKSAFAINVAEHVCRKHRVLYVSLEMNKLELADRLLAGAARVDSHKMRSGTIDGRERKQLIETQATFRDASLTIDDTPTRNVREIAAVARRLKRQRGLDLLVVDYIQFVDPEDKKTPRQEQVAGISRRLKGVARELNIPVLCLAQLNRQTTSASENKPQLSHLRESGAIEQDADVVLFVHRPWYYTGQRPKPGEGEPAEIIVAKQRNGPVGKCDVLWFGHFVRFDNPAYRVDTAETWEPQNNYGGFDE